MRRDPLLALGVVVVLAAGLAAYYYVHKPVTPAQAVAHVSVAADAGAAVLLALLGGATGRSLLDMSFPRVPADSRLALSEDRQGEGAGERAALHAALGWGAIGMAMLGLGALKLYDPALIWALTLAALWFLRREARLWLVDVALAARALWLPGRMPRLAALCVIITLGLGLLRALAPPLAFDALVYHLTLPQLYAQARGLRLDADIVFSGMPQLAEMLYTAATLLRGPVAAQALGWAFGAALALGLARHAAALLGARFSPLASAVLFSAYTLALSLSWAYADGLLMLLGLAMLMALRRWRQSGERRWLWLSGALAGLALGCKYTGVVVAVAGTGFILWSLRAAPPPLSIKDRPPSFLLPSSFFLLAALLASLPWLVKNLILTGNPVYPFIFPAPDVDPLRLWFYSRPDLAERNPLRAALIFVRAVLLGVQGGNRYEATLSPLYLVLPVFLGLGWRRLETEMRRELAPVIAFTLAGYAAWVALVMVSPFALQARLFFALLPGVALLCAGGLAALLRLDTSAVRVSFVVHAALALVLGVGLLENGTDFAGRSPLAYLAGRQNAADYRRANLGWYAVALEKVNALPAGSRVVFLWETRSLDCAPAGRCAPDVIIDRWWHLRRTVGSAEAILLRWQAEGVTHILVYDFGADFVRAQADNGYAESDWAELETLRARLRLVENLGEVYSLYALR